MADEGNNLSFLLNNCDGMNYQNTAEANPTGQNNVNRVEENQNVNMSNNLAYINNDQYAMNQPVMQRQQSNMSQEPQGSGGGWKINLDAAPENTMPMNPYDGYNTRNQDNLSQAQIQLNEIHEFYAKDDEDPLLEQKAEAKKKAAAEFRQLMMSKFPNRYFILKRITSNPELWTSCVWERSYVIISDENYAKKQQNCYEVVLY